MVSYQTAMRIKPIKLIGSVGNDGSENERWFGLFYLIGYENSPDWSERVARFPVYNCVTVLRKAMTKPNANCFSQL